MHLASAFLDKAKALMRVRDRSEAAVGIEPGSKLHTIESLL